MKATRDANAFTIVELLVVIAVIAILVGILIPAVNSAREAGRRNQCQANMRNIGLSILNYETRQQKFPPASTYNVDGTGGNDAGHSIFVYLLPFLEEAGVFERVDRSIDWKNDSSTNSGQTQEELLKNSKGLVKSLRCPSAPEFRTAKAFGQVRATDIVELNITDYVPVHRVDAENSSNPPDYNGFVIEKLDTLVDSGVVKTSRRGTPAESAERGGGNPKWNGILQEFPTEAGGVRTSMVRDGMSFTFLFFECGGRPEHYYGSKRNQSEQTITYYRWADKRMPIVVNNSCNSGQVVNCHNNGEVYSFHKTGANFVMADGSVAYLEEGIDPEVFVSLYTIAGGELTDDSLF
jgi:prepilin-type N-terminal cleavage/methylation domain-containing protein/prepilin-type processing-associated H-X9-DG protein